MPAATSGLLAKMGLGHGAVRNVIMHRDIVPRAFACDYTLVADLLARVSNSFRNHQCLHAPHRKVRAALLCCTRPSKGARDVGNGHFRGAVRCVVMSVESMMLMHDEVFSALLGLL